MVRLFLLFSLFATTAANAWFDPDWGARQAITVLSTAADADLSGFPVLVRIEDSGNTLFSAAHSSGYDIVFTTSDGTTQLPHEIEFYDASAGELYAWVRVPLLSSTVDTTLFLYYGNATAPDQQDAVGTWDSDFVMVQHLQETSGSHVDSTAYSNDGTPQNGVDQNAAGRVDGADSFDGADDHVEVVDDPSLRVVEMTVEAWVYVPGSCREGSTASPCTLRAPATGTGYTITATGSTIAGVPVRCGAPTSARRSSPISGTTWSAYSMCRTIAC